MHRHALVIILGALCASCGSDASVAPPRFGAGGPPPGFDWVETFHERCQATAPDPRVWQLMNDVGWSPKIVSVRVPENVVLKGDGICRFVYRQVPTRGKEWTTGGMVSTGLQQAYGYFEVRMKYAPAMGAHQSFWIHSPNRAPSVFEIDINEGEYPSSVSANLHQPGLADADPSAGKGFKADVDLSADFHTYGLLWLPDPKVGAKLTWYMDGQPFHSKDCARCTSPAPVLLTGAVVSWARPSAALDGQETQVTDLRIYQLRERVQAPPPPPEPPIAP